MSIASEYATRYMAIVKRLESAKLELQQLLEPKMWQHPATRVTALVHHEGGLQLGSVHLSADEARSLAAWIQETFGPNNVERCYPAVNGEHAWRLEQPGHFRCEICQRVWLGEPSGDQFCDKLPKDPTEFEMLPGVKAVEMCPITRSAHNWEHNFGLGKPLRCSHCNLQADK